MGSPVWPTDDAAEGFSQKRYEKDAQEGQRFQWTAFESLCGFVADKISNPPAGHRAFQHDGPQGSAVQQPQAIVGDVRDGISVYRFARLEFLKQGLHV